MRRQPAAERRERAGHDRYTFRRQPDAYDLDDDRFTGLGVFATKYRAHAAGTDLMQDAEATVGRTGAVELEAVLGQWVNSSTRNAIDWGGRYVSTQLLIGARPRSLVDTPRGRLRQ
jgi:hypothetical protein